MEFISAEEFFKQPKEIRDVFFKWWQPSIGDVVIFIYDNDYEYEIIEKYYKEDNLISTVSYTREKEFFTLILTEGQLRQFIEDNCLKIEIQSYEDGDYTLTTFLHGSRCKQIDCNNLLQAYWKLALEIAKELI